jgi:hypothetical protein
VVQLYTYKYGAYMSENAKVYNKIFSLQKSISIRMAVLTCRVQAETTAGLHGMMKRNSSQKMHCVVF